MKLSVIDRIEDMDEIVPKISAFANTQNKIQMADFSANDPFHRRSKNYLVLYGQPLRKAA